MKLLSPDRGSCDFVDDCPFFDDALEATGSLVRALKGQYCQSRFDMCARYKARKALGKKGVPYDLWPNDKDYLLRLMAAS